MAATTRHFGSLREMCIFYLCYILLSGFSYKETTLSTGGISCSFALAKTLTRVELPAFRGGHRKFDTRSKTSLAIRLMKTLQLTQYCFLAVLVLLAGDIEPNPGWNRPALSQQPGLKIAHLNIRSLPGHLDEFRILMKDNPFDIMCLTETWLNSSDTDDELLIDGYNLIRNDRKTAHRGGGSAIYYNSKLWARQRTDLSSDLNIEATWLEVTFPNRSKMLVCSTYCPDKDSYQDYKSNLEIMLERASEESIEQMYIGDLNQDLLPKRLSTDARDLVQLFTSYQFTQLIKTPTRITARSQTLLDHIYTTDKDKVRTSGVMQCSISDHSLIYLIRRSKKQRGPSKIIHFRNFKSYSSDNFQSDLQSVSWDDVNTSLTVDDAYKSFITTLKKVSDRHAPLTTRRVRAATLPWLTSDIRDMMRTRDYHHKRAQKTKDPLDWSVYRDLRNKTTKLIRDSKRDYYSDVIDTNKKDSGKLWKTLKSAISNTKKSKGVGSLDTINGLTFEPHEIAKGFASYFRIAVSKIRENMPSIIYSLRRQSPRSRSIFRLSEVDETFVCNELKKINASKSTGLVDIPARLLKDSAPIIARPLTTLMNRSLSEGSVPSDWKHAVVTPIHKSGSTSDAANYRPISTLPVFSKILERAVHTMVYAYFQENNLLSNHQSGYRPLHSTSTCLIDVTNRILQNIDRGRLTGMIFLDLTKAFDTIDHDVMLNKLLDLGFSDTALVWFRAYLSNRTQSVCVNGVLSDPQSIEFGVPQGSLLGPLLFITYINDLPSVVMNCEIQLYADDTLLFYSGDSISDIEFHLSQDLNNMINWLENNFLFLNYAKTKVMLVGTHQRLARVTNFSITARNKSLDRVYQFKYLGVILDPCLSWNDHIDYIASKISSRLGMLRKARKIIPRASCITLYDSMVLPLFDYCSAVWSGCGITNREYLNRLQRRAVRIIEGREVKQNDIRSTLNWPSLEARRNYQTCLQVFKCLNGLAPAYLLNKFSLSRDFHSHNTRNKDLIRLPRAKTSKFQTSFYYNGAKLWNTLPPHIRQENTLSLFKKNLKKHLSE